MSEVIVKEERVVFTKFLDIFRFLLALFRRLRLERQ
jgi:hypothetical protein